MSEVKELTEHTNSEGPNVHDYDLRTPLHVAACEGQKEIVAYLIKKKANINAKDRFTCNTESS